MTRVFGRMYLVTIALGVVVNSYMAALHAQESAPGTGRERQPRGRDAAKDPQKELENAATDYVERRKQAAGEALQQRQRAEQQAMDAERARRSASGAALTDSPKSMFVITLWAVRLNDSDKNADDGKLGLPPRTEFPTEFGSIDSVRQLINRLAASGRVRSSRELRVLALDGQSARVQVGAHKPQVTGVSMNNMGRSNTLNYRALGAIVQAKPHVDSEKRIQVELQYSMSDMEPSNDVPIFESSDGKSKVVAEVEVSHELQTTVKMKNGAAVLIKCDSSSGSAGKSTARQTDLIILGCETVPAPE